jgi:hypothetical protein
VTRLIDVADFPEPADSGDDDEAVESDESEEEPEMFEVLHPIGNLAVSGPWLVTVSEEAVSVFGPVPEEKEKPETGD